MLDMLRGAVSTLCAVRAMRSKSFDGPMPPQKLLPGWMLVTWLSATCVQGGVLTGERMRGGHLCL